MRICFFGSSLVSSYWNGAATYYRGLLKALAAFGHEIVFFEPDAYERQQHRDIDEPAWACVVVFPATESGWQSALEVAAEQADLLVKASGLGVFDRELEIALPDAARPGTIVAFWDVDAPATLDRIAGDSADHMHAAIPRYDAVFTYGGGAPVVGAYGKFGARFCEPIYNAVDPDTHHPAPRDPAFDCDLSFLGNRLPDREARVGRFFLEPAKRLPQKRFLLGGAGWQQEHLPANVRATGHVNADRHNAFFTSGRATLNVSRESMARYGFSPATRVFEAAGAGACLITDAWVGIEEFFDPGKEILIAATGDDVADLVESLTEPATLRIGRAALQRVRAKHTYRHRAEQVTTIIDAKFPREAAA